MLEGRFTRPVNPSPELTRFVPTVEQKSRCSGPKATPPHNDGVEASRFKRTARYSARRLSCGEPVPGHSHTGASGLCLRDTPMRCDQRQPKGSALARARVKRLRRRTGRSPRPSAPASIVTMIIRVRLVQVGRSPSGRSALALATPVSPTGRVSGAQFACLQPMPKGGRHDCSIHPDRRDGAAARR